MQGKPNSFKTGLKTTLKFNIRLGSSMLTYPDRPCKMGTCGLMNQKKHKKLALVLIATTFGLQEVER